MGREISFWWDMEKRIRVAKAGEKSSLFYEAYRQALAGVAEIVRASAMQERSADPFFPQQEGQKGMRTTCDRQYLYDYPNNIIVFSGERGAGKSSAMLTFVSSLKDENGLLFQEDFLSSMVACELPNAARDAVAHMLRSCRFLDVAPIDPTTLEDNGQILTVILARMFRLAASVWEDGVNQFGRGASTERLEEKNKLIQKFSTCYEHIQAIKRGGGGKPEYEGLETLAELGDSSRLKVELYELVEQLLRFCRPEAGDSSYLVLQIDDTDMNIKKAYDILEDVRRYLVIPRLIIVMAADLKHLTQVVESSLLKDYDNSLDARHEYVEKITHQYITKLFPQTRQIDLPALGTYLREHAETTSIRYQIPGGDILPDGSEFSSPQDQIIRLIYRKTGMVFLKQEHRLHPVIPCNMRLLAHFLSMLIQMEDVDDPDAEEPGYFLRRPGGENTYEAHAKKLRTRLQNIQRFRNYFLSTWVNSSLSARSVQMFKELEQAGVADRVRYICVQLNKRWREERAALSSNEIDDITGDGTYADMMRICLDIAARSWDEELKRLVFALQTYCSLFAHTLALEDLIDYYEDYARKMDKEAKEGEEESQYGPGTTGLGCSFVRLYEIFGSQLFPYAYTYAYSYRYTSSAAAVYLPDNGGNGGAKCLRRAWNLGNPLSVAGFKSDMKQKQHATLLYAMLLEYRWPDGNVDQRFDFDLTKPITNCLYLGDRNGLTPISEIIEGASDPLNVSAIGEEPWHIMGNSALITVLNSDVQLKIGAALQKMEADPRDGIPQETIDYNVWLPRVKDVYAFMKESLGKGLPIKFLEKIDFSKWLEPLATKGVNSEEGSEYWKTVIENLNAGVTYTPPEPQPGEDPPETPPPGETPPPDVQEALEEDEARSEPLNLDKSVPDGGKTE